jgi:transcriptional regulator with XRE-family HTH domain
MADGSGFGREVRGRRLELGMSQSRVAEAVGVPIVQIGRWERGEDVPDPARASALAQALDVDPDRAGTWLLSANPADTGSVDITDKNRFSGHSAPPPTGSASSAAVVPVIAESPNSSVERALRRRARRDERRLRRELTVDRRQVREQVAAEERRRTSAEGAAIRSGTLPMPPGPRRRPAPAPAGTANTGSVFPVPDTKTGSERVTYQGLSRMSDRQSRLTYPLRIAGTIAALLVLAGALWWAVSSLGNGLSEALDLLRGGDEPMSLTGAIGLLPPG